MEILQSVITLLSLIGVIVTAIANVAWSEKYKQSKEEQLKSKDEQLKTKDGIIESLEREIKSIQELNPIALREYTIHMKEQLEEYIATLKRELKAARSENQRKSSQISILEERLKKQIRFVEDPRYKGLFDSLNEYVSTSGSAAYENQAKVLEKLDDNISGISTYINNMPDEPLLIKTEDLLRVYEKLKMKKGEIDLGP